MEIDGGLEVGGTLAEAYRFVTGKPAVAPTPELLVSAYLFSLTYGYGLSESQHVDPTELERPTLLTPVREYLDVLVPGGDDQLRRRLYELFLELAADADARRALNHNSPLSHRDLLVVAQVAWNIERSDTRPLLPIAPGPIVVGGARKQADIPADEKLDFATMNWTDRSTAAGQGKATGAGFRRQVARLAVLAACRIVETHQGENPSLDRARLVEGAGRRLNVGWTTDDAGGPVSSGVDPQLLVGNFVEVAGAYQPRSFERELDDLWSQDGDRRVWLRGGPGFGKTYAARRAMQKAIANRSDDLLIWVDSAGAESVTRELSRAAERIDELAGRVLAEAPDRVERLARELLEWLPTTDRNWMVVLDDAAVDELIDGNLIPSGVNPRGRVLLTTVSGSHRIDTVGRQIEVERFSKGEAIQFLEVRLSASTPEENEKLASGVWHHPLTLSIAASTIAAHRMAVADWLADFDAAQIMDEAADSPDSGGYPRLVGAAWKLALSRATGDQSDSTVQRAAMVAALQDPVGHPTWLWQHDAVLAWIARDSGISATSGRMHPAVRKLVDHGILRLDGTWKHGRIALHQLAARAIRENVDPAALAELAGILADAWLMQFAADESILADVKANLFPLYSLPRASTSTRNAAASLLRSAQQRDRTDSVLERHQIDVLEPYLELGGATGRVELARRFIEVGSIEARRGAQEIASANFTRALSILQGVIEENPSDVLSSEWFGLLGDVELRLGNTEEGMSHVDRAARLLRDRLASDSGATTLVDIVTLAEYWARLDDDIFEQTLDSLVELLAAEPELDARMWERVGTLLGSAGRTEAIASLEHAASLYATTQLNFLAAKPLRVLARFYCAMGAWAEAESSLISVDNDPAFLAGVQLRLGKTGAARSTLGGCSDLYVPLTLREHTLSEDLAEMVEENKSDVLAFLIFKAMQQQRWADAADLSSSLVEIERGRSYLDPGESTPTLATTYRNAGITALQAGRALVAVDQLESASRNFELLAQLAPDDSAIAVQHAQVRIYLAIALNDSGSAERALPLILDTIAFLAESPNSAELVLALSVASTSYERLGRVDEELAMRMRVIESAREPEGKAFLSEALFHLTRLLFEAERWGELESAAREHVQFLRSRVTEGTIDSGVAAALTLLTWSLLQQSRPDEALTQARELALVTKGLLDDDPGDVARQAEYANSHMILAQCLTDLDQDDECLGSLRLAAEYLQLPAEVDPRAYKEMQSGLLRELAGVLRTRGLDGEADAASARADDLDARFPLDT